MHVPLPEWAAKLIVKVLHGLIVVLHHLILHVLHVRLHVPHSIVHLPHAIIMCINVPLKLWIDACPVQITMLCAASFPI